MKNLIQNINDNLKTKGIDPSKDIDKNELKKIMDRIVNIKK
ncbi:hypothetical protein P5F02_05410 [Clostridium perfringens]|nr:hypothetical protein [Clostridium perfringens]MDK0576453.1 hypothetical protein [Clostridium perfringens]MDK0579396.1 hypothetical protein [Clostridium perfringens]SUY33400.1 Uncharacterised protein [Clostridium perfringens]